MDLSKREKKIARQLIEIGLQKEFNAGLQKFENIIKDWKENKRENRESYLLLYKTLTNFDKHIARRYDGLTASSYILVVATQLKEGLLSANDLAEFSEATKNILQQFTGVELG